MVNFDPNDICFKNNVLKTFGKLEQVFHDRNTTYKQNFNEVSKLLKVLYPNGISAKELENPVFPLLVLKLVKLTRFVQSGSKHLDSIEDDSVYSVLIASTLKTVKK